MSLPRINVWVVAVSWCIASAALCAQPLLLHAELAGTAQRSHSVGLLAGRNLCACKLVNFFFVQNLKLSLDYRCLRVVLFIGANVG